MPMAPIGHPRMKEIKLAHNSTGRNTWRMHQQYELKMYTVTPLVCRLKTFSLGIGKSHAPHYNISVYASQAPKGA